MPTSVFVPHKSMDAPIGSLSVFRISARTRTRNLHRRAVRFTAAAKQLVLRCIAPCCVAVSPGFSRIAGTAIATYKTVLKDSLQAHGKRTKT
jgi:hypothetical protein